MKKWSTPILVLLVACGSGSASPDAMVTDSGSSPRDAMARDAAVDASPDGATPSGRVCVAVSRVGRSCGNTDDCDRASYCMSSICEPRPAEGESCGDGVYCAAGLGCGFDLMGGGSMLCEPLPTAGETCALAETGPFLCAPGFGCRMGVCGDLPGDGEMCTIDNRCAGELGCDFRRDGSFCAPRRADGAACESDTICQPGSYCDFGSLVCKPIEALGAPCTDGNECGSTGSCVPDDAGHFRCVTLPTEGEPCFFDCAPGLSCMER